MRKTKKLIVGIFGSLMLFANSLVPAFAFEPWDVTDAYVIGFTCSPDCGGPYLHDAILTQTGSSVDGTGGYLAGVLPYDHEWDITSGNVTGNIITLNIVYTAGSATGTVMTMTGTIAPGGSMSGTWTDNFGGTRTGNWSTASGNAELTIPEECDQSISYNLIEGTNRSEVLNGTGGNDLILAMGGSDVVDSKGGNDCIVGGAGSDNLRGGNGNDVILGGDGSDSIRGDGNNDDLYGEAGSDSVQGGSGNDDLFGGNQSDSLNGNGGVDSSDGGNGIDSCAAETETACES